VSVAGGTVREALAALVAEYPALDGRILDDGALPTFLNVFVDGEDVRLLAGLDTELRDASTVLLLPAVAGGSDPDTILLKTRKGPGCAESRNRGLVASRTWLQASRSASESKVERRPGLR